MRREFFRLPSFPSRCRIFSFIAALASAPSAPAQAQQDWLASLPPCSTDPAEVGVPRFELLYPRPGLPALVPAGARLIARVRLPSPLTPPPGVQQPRALAGFSAELHGHALPLAVSPAPAHRYPVEVVDVRPDATSTLLYRAAIAIPAFVAPGTYDLAFSAPGGSARVAGAVRVHAPAERPRLAFVADPDALQSAAAAALPVDLWLHVAPTARGAQPPAMARGSAPLIELGGQPLALRIGHELLVLGECGGPNAIYAAEITAVLARERRTRFSWRPPALAPGTFQPLGAAARALPQPAAFALELQPDGAAAQVAPDFPGPAEVALLIGPEQQAVVASARAAYFAASEIALDAPPARVVRLQIAPGVRTSLRLRAAAASAARYALEADPQPGRSGEPLRFAVRAAGGVPLPHEAAQVAFRFDALHTAFGPPAGEHRYLELGEHRVHALVLAADGHAERLERRVRVQTARAFGCAAAGRPSRPELAALWPALLLLQRRRSGRSAVKKHAGRSPRE